MNHVLLLILKMNRQCPYHQLKWHADDWHGNQGDRGRLCLGCPLEFWEVLAELTNFVIDPQAMETIPFIFNSLLYLQVASE